MHAKIILPLALLLAGALRSQVSDAGRKPKPTFDQVSTDIYDKLQASVEELGELREKIRAEQVPLAEELNKLEAQLIAVRREYQDKALGVDRGNLDVSTLQSDNKKLKDQAAYLSNLLGQYLREFETRLLIAEKARYKEAIENAKLAAENSNLSRREIYNVQADMVARSIERLEEALGGSRFQGSAKDENGLVKDGTFTVVGPATLFRSTDGGVVGTIEQQLDAVTPAAVAFAHPGDRAAAAALVENGTGQFPLDPTLGNAHKIDATEETFLEHVKKGGPVMYPIFAMAGLALLVALYKWLSMAFLRRPSKKQMGILLGAIASGDRELAESKALAMKGPTGAMLAKGVQHVDEPKDLIEEVMYENVMKTRLSVNRMLPFIAICAASAPLLGLLGTVTGIINTFKLITLFGSGDVKTLSGGISEALITTKFGLIVAIPSLLLHAYLSRKARGIVGTMERAAVTFLNQVSKSRPVESMSGMIASAQAAVSRAAEPVAGAIPDPELVRHQVGQILEEMLAPLNNSSRANPGASKPA